MFARSLLRVARSTKVVPRATSFHSVSKKQISTSTVSFAKSTSSSKTYEPVPSVEEVAVGPEREEMEGILEDEQLIGPFGTREHPTIVKSAFTSRIVGCTGGKGDSAHEILWHEVREGRPTVCMECGQFFQLEFDKEKVEKVLGYREQNAKNVGADTSKAAHH